MEKTTKLTAKQVKTIDINALEWFDKVNGNSYFAGTVTVNYGMKNETKFIMPYQYGYGSQSEQEAKSILAAAGLIPVNDYGKNGKHPRSTHELKEMGIIVRSVKHENCKKAELKAIK